MDRTAVNDSMILFSSAGVAVVHTSLIDPSIHPNIVVVITVGCARRGAQQLPRASSIPPSIQSPIIPFTSPWAAVLHRPIHHLIFPVQNGICAGLLVPLAPVLSRPLQHL